VAPIKYSSSASGITPQTSRVPTAASTVLPGDVACTTATSSTTNNQAARMTWVIP
jgi:hypothetical protein